MQLFTPTFPVIVDPLFRSRAAGPVDISDLTWEQREKVLRYLFARMNGVTRPPVAAPASHQSGTSEAMIQAAQQLPITSDGGVAG